MTHVYIASQTPNGGIYHGILQGENLTLLDFTPAPGASYLALDGDSLFALLRGPFSGESGVSTYTVGARGALTPCGDVLSTHGKVAAYLTRHRGKTYAVNYLGGTSVCLPDTVLAHHGHSVNPARQESPHPHCIIPAPDGESLWIADLGTDRLYHTDLALGVRDEVKLPDGEGPRHLAFSEDGKTLFCVSELGSHLFALAEKDGKTEIVDSISTLPASFHGENGASALRVRGALLYASNRGHDSLFVCRYDGAFHSVASVPCGRDPREFVLCGEHLLCGNDGDGTVSVFRLRGGMPEDTGISVAVPRPWGIVCREI